MNLNKKLEEMADQDVFGVADALLYGEKAPPGHRPSDFLKGSRSIVLVGKRMLDVPLDNIPDTRREYTANFHMANAKLNEVLFEICGYLQGQGFKVFPIPYLEMPGWNLDKRSAGMLKLLRHLVTLPKIHETMNEKVLWENLSYRHMAAEAGLGEIGLNNLLLSPEHGSRLRCFSSSKIPCRHQIKFPVFVKGNSLLSSSSSIILSGPSRHGSCDNWVLRR